MPSASPISVSVRPPSSMRRCQSALLRARRETSSPSTRPTWARATSAVSDFVAWRLRSARWRRREINYADADGLPEIAHTIERFDRNCDFGHAAGVVAGFQEISDHALVTTDCRFDLRAHVIAGGLLPIHAPMLFDPKDMPVALGRRCCGSWSRHGPLAWRNDETGARVSGENGVENSAPIIGAIGHKRARGFDQLLQ